MDALVGANDAQLPHAADAPTSAAAFLASCRREAAERGSESEILYLFGRIAAAEGKVGEAAVSFQEAVA
jgi:hypothetical protein